MLVDVHAHLELCRKVDNVVGRAKNMFIIANGLDPKSNRTCLLYGKDYKNVRAALGLYPSNALKMSIKEIDSEIDFIRRIRSEIIGIGEVGIDFTYNQHSKQIKVFKKMIDLAMELNVPLIVHSRKAEKEAVEILAEKKAKKVIMHCFNGNFKLVRKILDNGWMFSIPLTVIRSEHFQKIAEEAPINNLLTETDSPYLGFEKENEPCNVRFIVEKIASIKKMSIQQAEEKLFLNCERVFGNFFNSHEK